MRYELSVDGNVRSMTTGVGQDHARPTYISQCAITKLSVTFEKAITSCEHLSPTQQGDLLAILKAQNLKYFDAAVHLSISDGHAKGL
jgi:hypothetical protein